MKVFGVDVGVALRRPPKTDEYRRVVVAAGDEIEASLLATQIAQADDRVVMATESIVTDWPPEYDIVGPDGTISEWHDHDCGPAFGAYPHWHPIGKVGGGDPYVEESDANPERRGNGCMIYRVGS